MARLPETQEIAELYLSGLTLNQVAERYGVTLQAVAYRLAQAGIPRRKPGANLRTPEVRERAKQNHPRGVTHPFHKGLDAKTLAEAYGRGVPIVGLAAQFGVSCQTIHRYLRRIDIELGVAGFSPKNHRPARDGHIVHSGWEAMVDNWLFAHEIDHAVHPRLPFGTGHRYDADFLVRNTFIEVWGVTRNTAYLSRRIAKLADYARHGLHVLEVWPAQLKNNDYSALHGLT